MAKSKKMSDEEIIRIAKERFKYEADKDSINRSNAIDDLEFMYIEGAQWSKEEREKRKVRQRPCMQINLLPKYSNQICGEMRQNKTKIKVRPVDSEGDIEIANIREGIIYNIEYDSNAETIYDESGEMMVDCGYGAYRVLTEYTKENPFLQKVKIELIDNPFSVYMDSNAKDKNYLDSRYGFIANKLDRKEAERLYPGVELPSGDSFDATGIDERWWDEKNVMIMEYFYKEPTENRMALLSDGRVMEYDEAMQEVENSKAFFAQQMSEAQAAIDAGGNPQMPDDTYALEIKKERTVTTDVIKWVVMTSSQILEKKDWSGSIIPIILIHAKTKNISGEVHRQGLIRNAKDPQRMFNHWENASDETIAMAPKAPLMATPKMIAGFQGDYVRGNVENLAVMMYNPDPSVPGGRPMREPAPQPPVSMFTKSAQAEENIKSTLGMYNADVGGAGRELSGAAIEARQQPGQTGNFLYLDNRAKGIAHCGKIVNDIIPHIYDTARNERLRNFDDSETFVPINTTAGEAESAIDKDPSKFGSMDKDKLQKIIAEKGKGAPYNNIAEGSYDVVISTGPAYATQRQESADAFMKVAMAGPQVSTMDKYYVVKNLDTLGMDEYADSLRKQMPYGTVPPKPGEKPPEPKQPTPQELFAMEMQKMEMINKQLDNQVQLSKMQTEKERQQTEQIQQVKETIKAYNEKQEGDLKGKEQLLRLIDTQFTQLNQMNRAQ